MQFFSKNSIVNITFRKQKNGANFEKLSHHKIYDKLICPVKAFSHVKNHLKKENKNTSEVKLYDYKKGFNKALIKYMGMQKTLYQEVAFIGKEKLGFGPEDIGTHSIISGAVLGMYLAQVPISTIMIEGRWSSDAVLLYM